jgi:hypothetical protein
MDYSKTASPITVIPQPHPVWLSGNKSLFEQTGGKKKGKGVKKTQKKKSRKNKTRHRKTGRI